MWMRQTTPGWVWVISHVNESRHTFCEESYVTYEYEWVTVLWYKQRSDKQGECESYHMWMSHITRFPRSHTSRTNMNESFHTHFPPHRQCRQSTPSNNSNLSQSHVTCEWVTLHISRHVDSADRAHPQTIPRWVRVMCNVAHSHVTWVMSHISRHVDNALTNDS